jgi:predicted component of type VI protein secretion system
VVEPTGLSTFFAKYGATSKEEFLTEWPGAFLLVRAQGCPPGAIALAPTEGFKLTIGSDEDCDLAFEMDQTLDPEHATISYHVGFKGWNIEDHDTSFATHVDNERLLKGRPVLLQDRQVIKPGGGLIMLQFYLAETLWARMNKAGLTSRTKRPPKPGT